ncbi:MAG: MBL fold metallo-hydrolase [Methylococcales bacterium]|nr:MBL fold metallo-hydrolase [Methylococcales bacterium]
MVRERIADDIYVFRSRRYAQVTAGAILTKDGVILIDTLFYPDQTRAVREFLEDRLGHQVRYVINTHYHADHTLGTCQFPHAQVISHAKCRHLIDTKGRAGLKQMQSQSDEFADVQIILPDTIFHDGHLNIHLGGKTLRLIHLPGHSEDLIGVYVVNDSILFASDTAMPVPTMFDGNYDDLVNSMNNILTLGPDSIVKGHREVALRGEVTSLIENDLGYLEKMRAAVEELITSGKPETDLTKISIESCGKSRIPLNGFVNDLHLANMRRLYDSLTA